MDMIDVPELVDLKFPDGSVSVQVEKSAALRTYSEEDVIWFMNAFVYSLASDTILRLHTETLAKLTGNSSPEERDTWPEQKMWAEWYMTMPTTDPKRVTAEPLLARMVTDAESFALGGNPTNAAKATYMAGRVLSNVKFYRALISEASRAKRDAFAMLGTISNDIPAMMGLMDSLRENQSIREKAFVEGLKS